MPIIIVIIGWAVVACYAACVYRRDGRRIRMHSSITRAERHLPPSQRSDLRYLERPPRRASRRAR
jgi:hypothetical protein